MSRRHILAVSMLAVGTLVVTAVADLPTRLIWNATASAPIGFYTVAPADALDVPELVAVMPPEPLAAFMIERGYVARGVPLVSGAAVRVEGQVAVFTFENDGPCYACLYDDEDEFLGDCQGNGVLAPVPGVIGTLMAAEALKLLLGWDSKLRNRLLLWDAKRGEWQSVALKRHPDCVICKNR